MAQLIVFWKSCPLLTYTSDDYYSFVGEMLAHLQTKRGRRCQTEATPKRRQKIKPLFYRMRIGDLIRKELIPGTAIL